MIRKRAGWWNGIRKTDTVICFWVDYHDNYLLLMHYHLRNLEKCKFPQNSKVICPSVSIPCQKWFHGQQFPIKISDLLARMLDWMVSGILQITLWISTITFKMPAMYFPLTDTHQHHSFSDSPTYHLPDYLYHKIWSHPKCYHHYSYLNPLFHN